MRVGDIVIHKKGGKPLLYECDFSMRYTNGDFCCGVLLSRIENNQLLNYGCDKNYFINNFKKYKKE